MPEEVEATAVLDKDGVDALICALADLGRTVIGPTARDGAIVLAEIAGGDELPYGWGGPFQWQLGARARDAVAAYEFDAAAARALIETDLAFGLALTTRVAATIGQRLRATRARLIDMYDPRSLEPAGNGSAQ